MSADMREALERIEAESSDQGMRQIARKALAAQPEQPAESEAVGEVLGGTFLGDGKPPHVTVRWSVSTPPARGTKLYAAPPAPAVPDGWKLVPVQPTDEMIYMMIRATANYPERLDSYVAMLAAAPEVPRG